jgi:hypothetical protein
MNVAEDGALTVHLIIKFGYGRLGRYAEGLVFPKV